MLLLSFVPFLLRVCHKPFAGSSFAFEEPFGDCTPLVVTALMFLVTILVVLAGYPVAFTLAGTALGFGALGISLGLFEPSLLTALAVRYFGTMTNEVLVAVPLFVFMGVMLERSKIAEQLLTTLQERGLSTEAANIKKRLQLDFY